MQLYMALAPPWAQILPQPPPAAKLTDMKIRMLRRRYVEAIGQPGARA